MPEPGSVDGTSLLCVVVATLGGDPVAFDVSEAPDVEVVSKISEIDSLESVPLLDEIWDKTAELELND